MGDTVSVMTHGGGVWPKTATLELTVSIGELDGPSEYLFESVVSLAVDDVGTVYALDRGMAQVRAYDRDGRFLRRYGREGQGPGELLGPQAVAVLSDGRVLVTDPRNRRVQTFAEDGSPGDEWNVLHPAFATSERLWTDRADRVLVVTRDESVPLMESEEIVIQIAGTGEIVDTTGLPTASLQPPMLVASFQSPQRSGRSTSNVPFWPRPSWGLHPDGRILLARGDDYAIDLMSADGTVFRIGRSYEPVPVTEEERRYSTEGVTRTMRRTDPNWAWDGPPVPEWKPPFQRVHIGRQGRIWTRVSTPGREEANPDHDPENPRSVPTRLVSETLFDVFEPDGTYLGQVAPPPAFRDLVTAFDGNEVWAVTFDDFGVQRVARFEIRFPDGA